MADKVINKTPNPLSENKSQAFYTITELVQASRKIFPKYTGALVEVALQETKRNAFSVEEAKTIVENFAKREVKR